MAETKAPVLDLTSAHDRSIVRIDGVSYELRTADDLSIFEFRRMVREAPQVAAMLMNVDPTAEEGTQLTAMLDKLCRVALDAPSEVHDRLNDVQRVKVFTVFTHLLLSTPPAARVDQAAETPAAGTTSSRGSRGSTRARRHATGSTKPRSAPSART